MDAPEHRSVKVPGAFYRLFFVGVVVALPFAVVLWMAVLWLAAHLARLVMEGGV